MIKIGGGPDNEMFDVDQHYQGMIYDEGLMAALKA